ncbi:MAG: protein kinase [Candidatus Promineifilaceae bacterium]|nr:protein kinase [Candidatus Promineifilaceae bacterium]
MSKASWIGQTLGGRYEIQELLGQGGMSAVYKAEDPNLRRVVAVKLIHPHLSNNEEFVRRFGEEAAAVAQLRHPNLIQVYDFNNDEDSYYIVFEFVPGETLQARLKRLKAAGRVFDVGEVIDITAKTADGMHYAHVKGLIHRDIKPANIILNVLGQPIIMDFGIAKIMGGTQHTATGAVLGTARYMSPEQIKGERIDPGTDIYSLGVTLFEMLGGRPPYESDSAMTLMMMHMTDPIPDLRDLRSDIPDDLVAVVNKALAKNRTDRYETAAEMAAALRAIGSSSASTGATIVDTGSTPTPDPGATVLEKAAVGTAAAAAGATVLDTGPTAAQTAGVTQESVREDTPVTPPPTPPPPITTDTGQPADKSGPPTWLFVAGGVVVVLLVLVGIWAAFLRDPGGGEEVAPPIVENPTDTPAVEATDAPATEAPATEAPATEEPEATVETPTDTPEPLPEGPTGTVDMVEGDVLFIAADGREWPADETSVVADGTQILTGAQSQIAFALEDESVIQVDENSDLTVANIAMDPQDPTQETSFQLPDGNILLRQPQVGNALVVNDTNEELLAMLQADDMMAGVRGAMSRRLQQEEGDVAAMAVLVQDELVRITCFVGSCFLKDREPLPSGQEIVITLDGVIISEEPLTEESDSYQRWQEVCDNCLGPVVPPIVEPTEPPPTDVPPTPTTAPEPTATEEPEGDDLFVSITGITVQNGAYVVSYQTTGYTEQLPGMHVHFYFDTVSEANAGSPGSGPWILYGGPRPFTQYTEADRPAGASSMCARVANADHSIIFGSGNCYPLP